MMAMDDKKRILLVRQYRLPADKYLWELPAGKLDRRREAAPGGQARADRGDRLHGADVDEAGVVLRQPRVRAGADDDLSRDGSDRRRGHADGRRADRDRWFKRKEVGEMIRDGKIEDAKTIIGYFLATNKRK